MCRSVGPERRGHRVCFLGGALYRNPLDPDTARRFAVLSAIADVTVIGFAGSLRARAFDEHAHFVLLPGRWPSGVRIAILGTAGLLTVLWTILRRRVEVLVTPGPGEGMVGVVARWMAGMLGRRVVLIVESHGDLDANVRLRFGLSPASVLGRWWHRMAVGVIRRADLLRAVSPFTRMQLHTLSGGRAIVEFPGWMSLQTFRAAAHDGTAPRPPIVMYAGSLSLVKGAHVLLEAFARVAADVPAARLVIAGGIADARFARRLRRRVAVLGLGHAVDFPGHLPSRVLARRLADAAVVVVPSLSEGFGRVIVEAMAAGTPVVASAVGGIPDLITDEETGFLVPPDNAPALAARLLAVLAHRDHAAAVAARARVLVLPRYREDAYAAGYTDLLARAQALLDRHRGTR